MTEAELRARIRVLLQSGDLPRTLPVAQKVAPGSPGRIAQIQVGRVADAACPACGDADPQVTYSYPDGRVVRLHAACDAVWQQERERL
jgi:hypothetical protein